MVAPCAQEAGIVKTVKGLIIPVLASEITMTQRKIFIYISVVYRTSLNYVKSVVDYNFHKEMKMMRCNLFSLGILGVLLVVSQNISACTGAKLIAADGSVVRGRTLEFAQKLNSDAVVIPRNYQYTGNTPSEINGLKWKTVYAVAGANFCGEPHVMDGVNEKGLSGGTFYFPGFTGYQTFEKAKASSTLAPWQLLTWILTSFKDIEEVKAAISKVIVYNAVFPPWKATMPLHYIITDVKGGSIVIEYVDGKLNIYDNPTGVLTNAPDFKWHLTNLNNYIKMSPQAGTARSVNSRKLFPLGQGSGMLGLPGDFTPPSRFVRVFFFAASSLPQKDGESAVFHLFHILNNFDIPVGTVRSEENKISSFDRTEWTSACDLKSRYFYYRTETNSRIRVLKLMECNLDAKKIMKYKMADSEIPEDISGKLR